MRLQLFFGVLVREFNGSLQLKQFESDDWRIENVVLTSTEKKELKKIEQTYILLAEKYPAEDYLADLFYIAALEKYGQKASIYRYINKLKQIEPDNEVISHPYINLL